MVGPASLVAVKTGQSLSYDTDFVIAEVNADILDYCEVEKDKFELAVADTKRVIIMYMYIHVYGLDTFYI